MKPLISIIGTLLLALSYGGCKPVNLYQDDDTGADDDDANDDDTGDDDADDDTGSPDICDGYSNETICDGDTAVFCDANGDIDHTEDCDTANDFYCWPFMGCISCYPGTRWCEGVDVVECDQDGQGWALVDECDELAGEVCDGGSCISLCDKAEQERSSIGCLFYGVDMEQFSGDHNLLYAIVVSNTHDVVNAHVEVLTKSGNNWTVYESADIQPENLHVFELVDHQVFGVGIGAGAGYKITSTIPVIAYQFNPLDGINSCSSDASLLLPASAYDTRYRVPSWGSSAGNSNINVVAEVDGTQVWITPSVATASGPGVPAGQAGIQMPVITLDEGDVLQVQSTTGTSSLDGSIVEADQRVGVYGGHSCANVPAGLTFCDHIEEQIFGIQTWGVEYVGARLPPRDTPPEYTVWHFMAGDDYTTLTFVADPSVTGMPPGNTLQLSPGETWETQICGTNSDPGDFYVSGTEAFLATQYMIGGSGGPDDGDPCMMQSVPVEQFLDHYVVLVPTTWINDRMTITRTPGDTITINGTNIDQWPQGVSVTTVPGNWEVVRILVADGWYVLEGTGPFGVHVAGYDYADSYCYPGGLNQQIINDL